MSTPELLLLEANALTVGWGKQPVAKLERLTVCAGEIVALSGPNGIGKSTVLKTLARQIKPLGGTMRIDGADAQPMTGSEYAQRVSCVPQLFEPPEEMSVEDVVALGRAPHQRWWSWHQSEEDRKQVQWALEQTGIAHLRKKPVAQLSGGERQGVAIAMALAQNAKLMLLDEPTAFLDYRHQMQLVLLMRSLKQQGIAMLIVVHDLNMLSRLADRVVLLKDSGAGPAEIAASGPPAQVLTRELLLDVYGIEVAITSDETTGMSIYTPLSIST